MSLVTLIRDYVDVANSTEQLDGYTLSSLSSLASHTLIFLFTVAKQAIIYCFTFHWLRDLSYFCFTPPSLLSSFANVGTLLSPEIANVIGIENQPLSHLLAFSDAPSFSPSVTPSVKEVASPEGVLNWNISTGIGIVFFGFINGCFSSMHLSAAHLVTIQRMLVHGVPAGLCSAFGTALGQLFFLSCILFGFRGLLLPWLALEPLQFLVGTGIILILASAMAQDRRTPTIQWSARSSLFIYACTSAGLAWCEQAAIFQWMGNLSFGAEPTFLESTPAFGIREYIPSSTGQSLVSTFLGTFGNFQQLTQNMSFLVAFFLGSVLGAFIIGFFLQRFLELVLPYKGVAVYYGLIKQANLPLATFLFAFGFGSMPYYGFDYLVTKGLGFVPHESLFKQTLFSPINLVSKTSQAKDYSQGRLEDQLALLFTLEGETNKSFAVDTTPFDDGQYLKSFQKRPQTFEDLNYRGEHLWTNRLSRISNIREQANQTQSSFLGPVFSWMRSFLWGDGPVTVNTINTTGEIGNIIEQKDRESVTEPSYLYPLSSFTEDEKRGRDIVHTPLEQLVLDSSPTEKSEEIVTIDPNTSIGKKNSLGAIQLSEKTPNASGFLRSLSSNPVAQKARDAEGSSMKSHSKDGRYHEIFGIKKELSPEMEEFDNYLIEFDRQFDKGFSNFYDTDPHSLIEVEDQWQEKRIKEKCYTNPIYKFLLNTEIDAFLARQPKSHWLSSQEEILLLKRRQLLAKYYDTLALTSQVSTSEALEQLVPKSYANAIYNHQFKGTLKIARRLFSVKKASLDFNKSNQIGGITNTQVNKHSQQKNVFLSPKQKKPPIEQEQTRIVKFDQPLFSKEMKNAPRILFHEELSVDPSYTSPASFYETQSLVTSSKSPFHSMSFITSQQRKQGDASEQNASPTSQLLTFGEKSSKPSGITGSENTKGETLNKLEETQVKKAEKHVNRATSLVSPIKLLRHRDFQTEYNNKLKDRFIQKSNENTVNTPLPLTPSGYWGTDEIHKLIKNENIFSLEQAESIPLYAGWDEELRKFVLTNRFQSRALAGYTFLQHPFDEIPGLAQPREADKAQRGIKNTLENSVSGNFTKNNGETVQSNTTKGTVFTTWPIPNPLGNNFHILSSTNKGYLNPFLDKKKSSKELVSSLEGTSLGKSKAALHGHTMSSNETETQFISKEEPDSLGQLQRYPEGFAKDQNSINPSTPVPQYPAASHAQYPEGVRGKGLAKLRGKGYLSETDFDIYGSEKTNILQKLPRNSDVTGFTRNIDNIDVGEPRDFKKQRTNVFLFQSEPATNDMANALLQWQKLMKENKQLSKEDKQVAKEKVSYWPENVRRANWSNELIDNDMEFDEPAENALKKKNFLWEFTPPYHGGFVWSGRN